MMKIAIVGAEDSVNKTYNILKNTNYNVTFFLKKEDQIKNTTKWIMQEEENFDGFFLTGIGIYHSLLKCEQASFNKPIAFLKRGAMSLIKTFWELKKTMSLKNLKIGFDIVEEQTFINICNEFSIKLENYYHQEYIFCKTENAYLKNYVDMYKNKKINCVLTSFGYIYKELKKLNIPVFRIQATNIEIEEEFKDLIYRIKLKRAEKNKIGVVILKINKNYMTTNILEERIFIEKMLIQYSKDIKGSVQSISADEYLLISNTELIKNDESLQSLFDIIDLCAKKHILVDIGIGEGSTVFNAEKNARKSLSFCKKEIENSIFISSDNEIKGPLFKKKELSLKIDNNLKQISENCKLNLSIIQTLNALQEKEMDYFFTSYELAKYLNITERSINRILKILIENNYVEEKKDTSKIGAGRPRRIFKFNF